LAAPLAGAGRLERGLDAAFFAVDVARFAGWLVREVALLPGCLPATLRAAAGRALDVARRAVVLETDERDDADAAVDAGGAAGAGAAPRSRRGTRRRSRPPMVDCWRATYPPPGSHGPRRSVTDHGVCEG
jgi:hypothetical protein